MVDQLTHCPTDPVDVSVVLPTRNRASSLADALESILQDGSKQQREVIVVDNGPSDETHFVVQNAKAASRRVTVRYAVEKVPGRSRALNRGIALAHGTTIAFTDDDVCVDSGWTDALSAPFHDPTVGAVGGRTLPRWPHEPPSWLRGPILMRLTMKDHGSEYGFLEPPDLPTGANMAVRAEILRGKRLPFDPALGNQADLNLGFEEWHLLREIQSCWRIAYAADAVVWHRIQESEMTWDSMRRVYFQRGFGLSRMERLLGEPQPSLPRGAYRALRAWRAARRTDRCVRKITRPGPEEANSVFAGYTAAGENIERFAFRSPRLADALARRLVRNRM